ncbi:response regulator [Deinococcus sedimenti]|uniref:Response regulator n=1 Tax=Deinococcus sedimenti TaxID=1867090 RepID=A0ABQ2SCB6_9DEIO|nr:response regulator [Deinococcus sedimenti]GGS11512.1 response regulator [Deinococcus sedimenti]
MPAPFHLLVIDDQASDLLLIQDTLDIDHPEVQLTLARDGREALAACEFGRCPDLILLDFHLTGQSGLDVLRALKRQVVTRRIPVVMFSASAAPADIDAAYAADAADYHVKPLLLTDLLVLLNRLIDTWSVRAALSRE